MKDFVKRLQYWFDNISTTNKALTTSANKLNTIGLFGAIVFIVFVTITLGVNMLVLITSAIPIIGFFIAYYLNYKNLHGQSLIIIFIVSFIHATIIVNVYEFQFLELTYLLLAIIPWFPFENLKMLKIMYLLSYICFLIFGFHLKEYNLFEIHHWPKSILIYFVMLNFVFIVLYLYLLGYKKNNLDYSKALIKKNKEIESQNELIKLNTKVLIQLEKEKHKIELECKQKDVELLNINNQLKIKMKNELIEELQKLKNKESGIGHSIQSIIIKLKQQIVDEKKIDLLQNNIDLVGSDFNNRIKQVFPNISKSEIELLSLIKLKLNNKQIATQKNTSPNTINVALHRLKQKCNFNSTNDLKNYIERF